MIHNKRQRTVEELWRDFPELRWRQCPHDFRDINGYHGDALRVWWRGHSMHHTKPWVTSRLICTGVTPTLKEAQKAYHNFKAERGVNDSE